MKKIKKPCIQNNVVQEYTQAKIYASYKLECCLREAGKREWEMGWGKQNSWGKERKKD